MKIYVARHGQTKLNAENRVCGSTDIPLTSLGLRQAEKLADNAGGKGIDIIISSPMIRATQTAQAVADRYNLPVVTDGRLREQDFGKWEGVSRDDADYQKEKRKYAHRHCGGESVFQLVRRVYARLDDIKEKYRDKNVLIVCHGGVCRTIRSYFEDMENEEYSAYSDNASLAEYTVE